MQTPPDEPTGLVLDRYHIDSAYVAWRAQRDPISTFDLSARQHPFGSGFLLVAGLEQAVAHARAFAFADDDIAFVRTLSPYDEAFLDDLRRVRFTGELAAMPEGTIAFAGEPLLRVTAPFREALLLESGLLHHVGLGTLLATKAARIVGAAQGRPVAEFGLRRSHDPFTVVRSAWIGGCASTSFVAAARRFGIPATGTIPHAVIQSFPSEDEGFRAIATALPRYTLLLDTYDVRRAIATTVEVAAWARARFGHELAAVRLDSGDLVADAKHCRRALDDAGLGEVRIVASGGLDEYSIDALVRAGAPVDAFGVGENLGSAAGSPEHGTRGSFLPTAYKLVASEGQLPVKHAAEKSTWPGRKQVWRSPPFAGDVIALDEEGSVPHAEPLLEPVLRDGEPSKPPPALDAIRERARAALAALPDPYKAPTDPAVYPVRRSEALEGLRSEALRRHGLV